MISQMLQNSTTCTFILYFISSKIYLFSIFCILCSTIRTFFQLQLKLFSFNKNTCSTSTKNNFIQQHYLFNFNFPVASVCKSAEQIPVRFLQWFSQNHVAFFGLTKSNHRLRLYCTTIDRSSPVNCTVYLPLNLRYCCNSR